MCKSKNADSSTFSTYFCGPRNLFVHQTVCTCFVTFLLSLSYNYALQLCKCKGCQTFGKLQINYFGQLFLSYLNTSDNLYVVYSTCSELKLKLINIGYICTRQNKFYFSIAEWKWTIIPQLNVLSCVPWKYFIIKFFFFFYCKKQNDCSLYRIHFDNNVSIFRTVCNVPFSMHF